MSLLNLVNPGTCVLSRAALQECYQSDAVLSSRQRVRFKSKKSVTIKNLNPNIVRLQYAVRGPLVIRAMQIVREIKEGAKKPFKRVIEANLGDAHAMGQTPVTFLRQVLACMAYPKLMETGNFPKDVTARAKEILSDMPGKSIGSYTPSDGIELTRKRVAQFIERRDGHKSRWEDICLSSGASAAIKFCLQLFCNTIGGKISAVMIPIPQYPLYSASLEEYGLGQVEYYLDEDNNWGLDAKELERAYAKGMSKYNVRALVVINPGNPTGQVLTRKNIEDIVKFCHKHTLFLFADEVYQDNVYAKDCKFYSFKKVMMDLGKPYNELELASFMSMSKGFLGECGMRGGWMELVNMDRQVQANLIKCINASLSPNSLGQATVDVYARQPQKGEPSFELWQKETTGILKSMNVSARSVAETFNKMKGFKCNVVQGSMYAFPKIDLPPKAIEAAKKVKMAPDEFYALKLLDCTGICIVPGTGFGQRPGTYHFRTTILPPPPMLREMLATFQTFHAKFAEEFK